MPTPTIYDYDGYEDYTNPAREHGRVVGTPTVVGGGRFGGQRLLCQATTAAGDYLARLFGAGAPSTVAAASPFSSSTRAPSRSGCSTSRTAPLATSPSR